MKRLIKFMVFLLMALAGYNSTAQILDEDTSTNQPFFKANKFNSKCYVGLDASVAQILKNEAAGYFGVNLNWVINHKFVVSAAYESLGSATQIQKIVIPGDNSDTIRLIHHYVGLGFSYIVFDKKLFSFQPGFSAGWGMIKYTFNNATYRNNFAEIVPALNATYNCSKNFRIGLGLNYRIAAGASLNGIKSADLSGVGGVIFIKVGTF